MRIYCGIVVGVCLAGPIFAKGQTVKIVINRPGLHRAAEVTQPKALANPWQGDFMDSTRGSVAEPSGLLPRYELSFYVELPRGGGVKMMYVVQYARNPATGEGFVHLPGRGEPWYRLNVSTILREGEDGSEDGKWYRASRAWSDAVAVFLP